MLISHWRCGKSAIYAEKNHSNLPIDNETMQLIIHENLTQNGGNLILIEDEILAWVNDYCEYMEADRYLSETEKLFSAKNIYECIICKDKFCETLNTYLSENAEGKELLSRLRKLLEAEALPESLEVDALAARIVKLTYDFDTYGSMDVFDNEEAAVTHVKTMLTDAEQIRSLIAFCDDVLESDDDDCHKEATLIKEELLLLLEKEK